MPEINTYSLNHREMAEVLIRHLDIREGKWFVSISFNFLGANFGVEPGNALPSALVQISKIGLQRAEGSAAPPELIVDAAEINAPPTKAANSPAKATKKR